MVYSTRKKIEASSAEAVVKGLSDDGGLFIFDNFADFKFSEELKNLNYIELATKVLKFVFEDFSVEDIEKIIKNAYCKQNFDSIVDQRDFADVSFLELWHGPTAAFKDMALTALAGLLEKAKEATGEKDKTVILTATSGDTGSATLSGFLNSPTNAIVLYPYGGVSPVQEAQMQYYAQGGSKAIAVEGNFDFCQTLVKKVFSDKNFKVEGLKLSSANSINLGRLAPQIVYYIYSYFELIRRGKISYGEEIIFSVPTGNFGNILAGYIAKKMGLPVKKFICASNTNDVLTDFFKTGVYDRNRKFFKTISPSMDILVSSNLERLLYLLSGGDNELIGSLMDDLSKKGRYEVPKKIKDGFKDFYPDELDDNKTLEAIKTAFDKYNYLIDPHTAVAYGALNNYRKASGDNSVAVVVSTASPYKFPVAVLDALKIVSNNDIFQHIKKIEMLTNLSAPKAIKQLENFSFKRVVWSAESAESELKKLIKSGNV